MPACVSGARACVCVCACACVRPFDGGTILEVAQRIGKGEPSDRAKGALEASGHEPELCALASSSGLLHRESDQRTPLWAVLERFPLCEAGDSDDTLPQQVPIPLTPLPFFGCPPLHFLP